MRRRDSEGEDQEPSLFDLPLDLPGHARLDGEPEGEEFEPVAAPAPPRRPAPVPAAPRPAPDAEPAADAKGRAGTGSRLSAGLADLLVHAAIAALALAGARFLGAEPTLAQWPPLALFLLSFSFLYTILPLAFWGQTLGMTWARLLSRNRDGEPLTFDQTARRWIGGLLTTATLGLPLLLAGRGRTLTDLLSGSDTYRAG
jgi:uncharacterized RDD family membrane protein YckC